MNTENPNTLSSAREGMHQSSENIQVYLSPHVPKWTEWFLVILCLLKGLIDPPESNYAKSPSSFTFIAFKKITKQISKKPITRDNK